MSDAMAQFRDAFFEEATELADGMEATLLSMDLADVEVEDLHTLFRAAHSIKGNAATFGFPAVAAFTHKLESNLEPVRQGTRPMTPDLREMLLQGVDLIRGHLHHARRGEPLPDKEQHAEAALIAKLQEDTAAAPDVRRGGRGQIRDDEGRERVFHPLRGPERCLPPGRKPRTAFPGSRQARHPPQLARPQPHPAGGSAGSRGLPPRLGHPA